MHSSATHLLAIFLLPQKRDIHLEALKFSLPSATEAKPFFGDIRIFFHGSKERLSVTYAQLTLTRKAEDKIRFAKYAAFTD